MEARLQAVYQQATLNDLITGHGSVENAVSSIKQGVRDYLQKPVDPIALTQQLVEDLSPAVAKPPWQAQLDSYLLFEDPVMVKALADLTHLKNKELSLFGDFGGKCYYFSELRHILSH